MTADDYARVLMALCIWREARGASLVAKRGVCWVIQNRISTGRWGLSAPAVILYPEQFSSFNSRDPNAWKLPDPRGALDWAAWLECCEIVDAPGDDPTNGATHYVSGAAAPSWANPAKLTAVLDGMRFYRLP